ncbi:MAG: hypothetical protein TV41_07930 [Wolbachia endosymbiont of Dactylopius coccus]|nr:MAG: hypothetical protein TV41_07930 [Wolbachia endosymbiont of Dactylopius coccus]
MDPEVASDKQSIVDVLCKDSHGNRYIAEMQLARDKGFEKRAQLYQLWNRMSSGSYFPEPVKAVAIPKDTGGQRTLCVPSVSDRVAQTAATMYLEPIVEPKFHEDSCGYRPNKSLSANY